MEDMFYEIVILLIILLLILLSSYPPLPPLPLTPLDSPLDREYSRYYDVATVGAIAPRNYRIQFVEAGRGWTQRENVET